MKSFFVGIAGPSCSGKTTLVKALIDKVKFDFEPPIGMLISVSEVTVSDDLKNLAYEDIALPLGDGATISQPYTIAFMLNLLELNKGQKVLEIGSGCGYVLALISEMIKGKIYGIEIIKLLAEKSRRNLRNYKNVKVFVENGFNGLEDKSPFDRILISAESPVVPKHLCEQLKKKSVPHMQPASRRIRKLLKHIKLLLLQVILNFKRSLLRPSRLPLFFYPVKIILLNLRLAHQLNYSKKVLNLANQLNKSKSRKFPNFYFPASFSNL